MHARALLSVLLLAAPGCRTTAVVYERDPVLVTSQPPAPPPPPPVEPPSPPPPPPPVVQVESNRIRVDDKIQFELNSAEISGCRTGCSARSRPSSTSTPRWAASAWRATRTARAAPSTTAGCRSVAPP